MENIILKITERIKKYESEVDKLDNQMEKYRFTTREKEYGSLHYGALQERQQCYNSRIEELNFCLKLIK